MSLVLPAGSVAMVTDYGGTVAVSDGVRWRLERLYSTWSSLPSVSLVPVGTEASITDCGGAIAVAGVVGWVFRPVEIFNSNAAVLINGYVGSSDQVAYQFTIPASLMGVKGVIATELFGTFSVASANSKVLKMKIGSSTLCALAWSASHKTFSALSRVKNITKLSQSNMDGGIFNFGASGGGFSTSSIDTSVDTTVQFTIALGNATETCTFQGIRATVYPAM
jgi:hypothetical protein